MKLLEKKRDELADEYIKEQAFDEDCLTERTNPGTPVGEHIYQTFCGCFVHDTFKAGFDSCLKELEPVLKELVNNYESLVFALQWNIIMFNGAVPSMTREQVFDQSNDIRDRAKDALQKYKQLIGEK